MPYNKQLISCPATDPKYHEGYVNTGPSEAVQLKSTNIKVFFFMEAFPLGRMFFLERFYYVYNLLTVVASLHSCFRRLVGSIEADGKQDFFVASLVS